MSWFRDLKVGQKIFCAFGVVLFLYIVLGGAAFFALRDIGSSAHRLAQQSIPALRALADVRYSFSSVRRVDGLMLKCDAADCVQRSRQQHEDAVHALEQALTRYDGLPKSDAQKDLFQAFRQNTQAYDDLSGRAMAKMEAGEMHEAAQIVNGAEAMAAFDKAIDGITQSMTQNNKVAAAEGQHAIDLAGKVVVFIALLVAGITVVCIFIGFMLSRTISVPLQAATEALERFARKDLTVRVEAHAKDETGRLASALNQCVDAMNHVLCGLVRTSTTLASTSNEVCRRASQTRENAQEQSARTSQIAAAAHEMTATIGEISQNAERASVASRNSAEAAGKGGEVMERAASTMERIGSSSTSAVEQMDSLAKRSNEIGNMVTVIQEISEQTNLLALNAAIEAARAGEQGRGFAVVAGEVRRLAERTKSATEEISNTVRNIQQETNRTREAMELSRSEVGSGTQETAAARTSLTATIHEVQQVDRMIELIAAATTEQTAASGEISEAAGQISQLAAASTQAADESAQMCAVLSGMVQELNATVHEFLLQNQQGKRGVVAESASGVAEEFLAAHCAA